MNGRSTRCRAWLISTVALTMLLWGGMPPAAANSASSADAPCPGNPGSLHLGATTPVLLVHGFNDGPTRFTSGSPSLQDTIKATYGRAVTPVTFDYSSVSTDWVTDSAIGPQLADCINWLADASHTQGGPGKVIIVAHSMGGLAIRCAVDPACVQGGGKGPAANPSLIGFVITLGTPNLGSNPQTAGVVDDRSALGFRLAMPCLNYGRPRPPRQWSPAPASWRRFRCFPRQYRWMR